MSLAPSENSRLFDLLADAASTGVDARGAEELANLLAGADLDSDSFERAAAALDVALTPATTEAMPAHLLASVQREMLLAMSGTAAPAAARAAEAGATTAPPLTLARTPVDAPLAPGVAAASSGSAFSWGGWFAAAACLAIAASAWMSARPSSVSKPVAVRGPAMIEPAVVGRADTLTIAWKPLADDTCKEQCAGRVIWNNDLQKGWMVFKGLAVNDPSRFQYQLWIIDKAQKHPVDGGVFDIASAEITESGEVFVPISAKIRVSEPAAFAVTVERPGGVVVSDQSRVAVLAPVSKG